MLEKYSQWLVPIAILIVAIVLRFWQLGVVPVSLYWDEMAMYVDVKSVLATGKDMHGLEWGHLIYPSYGDYKLAPYIWLATLASKFFGLSEWSIRFPSAVAGVATVALAGLIAAEFFADWKKTPRQFIQWVTMSLVATLPWSIQFSRTGFEGHLAQLFVTLSVWFALKARKYPVLNVLAAVSGVAATYSYYSARFVILPLLLIIPLWNIWQSFVSPGAQLKKIRAWKPAAVAMLLMSVVYGILMQPLSHAHFVTEMNQFRLGTDSVLNTEPFILEANTQRELAGNTIFDRIIFHRYWLQARALLMNVSNHLTIDYLFLGGDPNLRHGTEYFGILLITTTPLLIVGFWWLVNRRFDIAAVLGLWWGLALLPASVPNNTPHALRSLNGLVPVAIITAVGFVISAELLKKVVAPELRKVVVGGMLILIGINSLVFAAHYFSVYPTLSADAWQSGYKPLALRLTELQKASPDQYIQVVPFDDRFYLWLMGYGRYTPTEFQSWQSKGFSFIESIPQVVFKPEVDKTKNSSLVVGKYETLKNMYPESQLSIVNNEVGQPIFAIYQPSSLE